jgi:hypothetical protein
MHKFGILLNYCRILRVAQVTTAISIGNHDDAYCQRIV